MWLIFGLFYWAIAWQHNDIDFMHNPEQYGEHQVCVDQVFDFLAELVKVMFEPEEVKKAEMGKQLKVEKLPAFLASRRSC